MHPPLSTPSAPSVPSAASSPSTPGQHDPWYKYGVAILFIEMLIAITVSAYSLYMTFHGIAGFPAKLSG